VHDVVELAKEPMNHFVVAVEQKPQFAARADSLRESR
jgi:hypothetical protein